MARKSVGLGELELEVLKTIWQEQPCTVQEIAELLGKRRGCARTTVLTVMQRLHAKGFLKRRKQAGIFRYSATEPQEKVMSGLVGQFIERVLDGSPGPFVSYLAKTNGLSRQQACALRAIVKDLDKKSGEGQ